MREYVAVSSLCTMRVSLNICECERDELESDRCRLAMMTEEVWRYYHRNSSRFAMTVAKVKEGATREKHGWLVAAFDDRSLTDRSVSSWLVTASDGSKIKL
jgi:hypothetical protein